MTTTEANLIDMLGVIFANRGHEAILQVSELPRYKHNEEKYKVALKKLIKLDAKAANELDETAISMLNDCVDTAYFKGLQDGCAIFQLLTQKNRHFLELLEEAQAKAEDDISRPYAI